MERLVALAKRLRGEGGCPWDRSRTFENFAPCVTEEAGEVVEAIGKGDFDGLEEELGDLLWNVVFLAHLAEEAGHFDLDRVIARIERKMIHRHPHVFEGETAAGPEEALARFNERKREEREGNISEA